MQVYFLYARAHRYIIISGINIASIVCYRMHPEDASEHRFTLSKYNLIAGVLSFDLINGYNYLE
jgi:hypothetical protein